jgi:hypothetical protein
VRGISTDADSEWTARNRQAYRLATGLQQEFGARRDGIAGNRQVTEVGIIGQILPGGLAGRPDRLALQQPGVELRLERRPGADFQGRCGVDVDDGAVRPDGSAARALQHPFEIAGVQQQHSGSKSEQWQQPVAGHKIRPSPAILEQQTAFLRAVAMQQHQFGPPMAQIPLQQLPGQADAGDDLHWLTL